MSENELRIQAEVIETKHLRKDIDDELQRVRNLPQSLERDHVIMKLSEGIMWLGMNLKRLNEPNPYSNSKDPTNVRIEPTADNLTL
jgi:hypothetical protein